MVAMKGGNISNLVIFIYVTKMVSSFNIETKHNFDEYDIGTGSSMFGYTVALVNNRDAPLIVGAPEHDGKGAIFKCSIGRRRCEEVEFVDTTGTTLETRKRQTDSQKFGFSLSKVGKRIIACAPKFKALLETQSSGTQSRPIGKCSIFDENLNLKYSEVPCEDSFRLNGYNFFGVGYCLAGISTTGMPVETFDPMFFIGTPGTRHATGSVFSLNSDRPVKATERLDDFARNSYIGYSVSAGHVIDQSEFGDVIAGAPRGNLMNGHAILYKYKNRYEFTWKTNVLNPHEQIGSFFGSSICIADMNNDEKDDVLIGAPYYSKERDEGRVYIYQNTYDGTYDVSDGTGYKYKGLQPSGYLDGDDKVGSMFGTTIVNIGDMNRDGYTDVAVGAPGGDVGAVYIYNGAKYGLKNQYSQVILASSVPGTPKGFGISIASGIDIDGNKYNDLAIGAHLSSKAYVFKSRAVVQLSSSQRTNITMIPSDMKKANCEWKNVGYYCFLLDIELTYSGEGIPDTLELDMTFSLDHEAVRKRAFMISPSGKESIATLKQTLTMEKKKKKQVSTVLFAKMMGNATSDFVDILQPISLLTSFQAQNDPAKCNGVPCGVLNNVIRTIASEVVYEHKCGDDDTCEPDLSSKSSILFPDNLGSGILLYGVIYEFLLTTVVVNLNEPGYQAKMRVGFSTDFNVDRVEINRKAHPIWNVEISEHDKQLKFVFANPIQKNHQVDIAVKFSVPLSKPSNSKYAFSVEVSSFGNELKPTDNKEVLELSAKVDACLAVKSDVSPSFVSVRRYKNDLKSNTSSEEFQTKIEHVFMVKNEAEVPVESLTAHMNLVVAKADVILMCISEVSINGKRCRTIPEQFSCRNTTNNMTGNTISNNEDYLSEAESRNLNCNNAQCATLSCDLGKIRQGKTALISVKSQLVDSKFWNVYRTVLEATISLNFKGKTAALFDHRRECSLTSKALLNIELLSTKKGAEGKKAPFWIYIVSAAVALLLLGLAIFIMHKVGFFARKRPGEEEEEEAFNPIDEEDEDD